MTIGRPFQKGDAKRGGRQKGTQNKDVPLDQLNSRIRRHLSATLARHEKTIGRIDDPLQAMRLDAQVMRDMVELVRHLDTTDSSAQGAGGLSDAQIEKRAHEAGPVPSDEDCMKSYLRMISGEQSDELRILVARFALSTEEQLPALLTSCKGMLEAIEAGEFTAHTQIGSRELGKLLASSHAPPPASVPAPLPVPTPQRTSEFEHSDVGIPFDGSGSRYIPATPRQLRQRDAYPDPAAPVVPIDAEPTSETREDADPWSDSRVTVVMGGGFVR